MRVSAFAVLFGAFLALLSTVAPASAWELRAMNDQIEKTNVIVSEICSGTVIDIPHRLVLTAHHCVVDNLKEVEKSEVDAKTGEVRKKTVLEAQPMFIETWKRVDFDVATSHKYQANIVGYDKLTDVAILQVVDPDWKPEMAAPLAPADFDYMRGKVVYAVGNPGIEFDNSVTTGIISAPARRVNFGTGVGIPLFQHSANTIGGNSGGAIYNDKGEIIGTVTGGLRGSDISLAVPIIFTKALLKRIGFGDVVKN